MLIYQTVIPATADILEILSRIWTDPTLAEGVVLIDELDAHLHPAWQMRIVGSLRRALPGAHSMRRSIRVVTPITSRVQPTVRWARF